MATRKCGNIYFRKYFMAARKFTNIFVLLLILMVRSRSIHYKGSGRGGLGAPVLRGECEEVFVFELIERYARTAYY